MCVTKPTVCVTKPTVCVTKPTVCVTKPTALFVKVHMPATWNLVHKLECSLATSCAHFIPLITLNVFD